MILDFLFRKSGGTTRIVTSQQLADYLGARSTSSSGVTVTVDRALQYAAVFACVRVLAESVGQLPLHLYVQKGRSKEKAKDHPLYQLLHVAPNAQQTAQEWREWLVSCLALRGNAYCHIIRARPSDRVLELNPFSPGAVTPRVDRKTGELVYEIRQADGQTETLPAEEVLHVKLFPLDGLVGASPIAYARESIGLGIATESHGAGLFARGASPGGVLEMPGVLSEDAAKRVRDTWETRHSGSENAGRIAVLEHGMTWKSIGMSSEDAQFLETRKYQRSEVAGVYRVPPHLIGDLERATFSNIEHSSLDFVVHSLMPYLTRIEQRIAMQLLTPKERETYFAKFTVNGLLRGDMSARAAFYTQMVQNGALSPNEIRELEDMNPREGGDVWLVPMNLGVSGGDGGANPKPEPEDEEPDPAEE